MKYNGIYTLDALQVILSNVKPLISALKKLEPHCRSFAEGPTSQKLRQ